MYLPSIGFSILAAVGLRRLPSLKGWSAQAVQCCAVAVLCSGYVCASLAQQVYWGNDLLLLVRGQSLYPGNPYTMAGWRRNTASGVRMRKRLPWPRQPCATIPSMVMAVALAESYIHAGRYEEGRQWLERVNPEYAKSEVGMAGVAGCMDKWATMIGR